MNSSIQLKLRSRTPTCRTFRPDSARCRLVSATRATIKTTKNTIKKIGGRIDPYQLTRNARKKSYTKRHNSNIKLLRLGLPCDGGSKTPSVLRLNASTKMRLAIQTEPAIRYFRKCLLAQTNLFFQISCNKKAGTNTTAINLIGIKTPIRIKPTVWRHGRPSNTRNAAAKKTA